jgi:hypothetical protein
MFVASGSPGPGHVLHVSRFRRLTQGGRWLNGKGDNEKGSAEQRGGRMQSAEGMPTSAQRALNLGRRMAIVEGEPFAQQERNEQTLGN